MGYQNQKVSSDRKGACLMGIDSLDRFLPILEREIAFHYILFAFQYTKPLWKMVILWRERNFSTGFVCTPQPFYSAVAGV